MLLGAGGAVAFDMNQWRDAGAQARSVAVNAASSTEEQIEAMVAIQRDICAGLRVLHEKREGDDATARTAEHLLTLIDAARQK